MSTPTTPSRTDLLLTLVTGCNVLQLFSLPESHRPHLDRSFHETWEDRATAHMHPLPPESLPVCSRNDRGSRDENVLEYNAHSRRCFPRAVRGKSGRDRL